MSGLSLTIKMSVSDRDLTEAISLICSPVFGALDMANALGGHQSAPWQIVRMFTPRQMVDDAIARDLDLSAVKAACSDVLVFNTPILHNILEYDPRSRCSLCCRPHSIDHRTGERASCGRAQRLFNPPEWRWTKISAQAAFDGLPQPSSR